MRHLTFVFTQGLSARCVYYAQIRRVWTGVGANTSARFRRRALTTEHRVQRQFVSGSTPVSSLGMGGSSAALPGPEDVLKFWFPDPVTQAQPDYGRWFQGGDELDAQIQHQFGSLCDALSKADSEQKRIVQAWQDDGPVGVLALTIVADQFFRNVYRRTADAFKGDELALRCANLAMQREYDINDYGRYGKSFGVVLPLMHSENLEFHNVLDARFRTYRDMDPSAAASYDGEIQFEQEHRIILEQFGRYPHRNAALGRTSSKAELEFIKGGNSFGQ